MQTQPFVELLMNPRDASERSDRNRSQHRNGAASVGPVAIVAWHVAGLSKYVAKLDGRSA